MSHCCDMRGFLSFLVLRLISKKPRSGEDIRKEIEIRKGARPSPGTIYPVLKHLHEHGLIIEMAGKSAKEKKYAITSAGKKELQIATRRFVAMFCDMKEEL
jgi:PadR family transcriptional regulator, regulatory protein PadR